MRTNFTQDQLAEPDFASSEKILRRCVHCGFCTATCPTYMLLGDELDSPRGRIYLIKEMLEIGAAPAPESVKHIDRCLSCLSCVTTCPSGVDYMHLVDHARSHIERTFTRPVGDRLFRRLLGAVLSRPRLFRAALAGVRAAGWLAPILPAKYKKLLTIAPRGAPSRSFAERPRVFPAIGERRARVALLSGCVQPALAPSINEATVRLLTRHGIEVVIVHGTGCCGALHHHLGDADRSRSLARANIRAWMCEIEGDGLNAILMTASGCGTMIKDYGHVFRDDPQWSAAAASVSSLARDISEFVGSLVLSYASPPALSVAYQSPCSMHHGQNIKSLPSRLLAAAGFRLQELPEAHVCCGSSGTYSLLQPEIAGRLRRRKQMIIEAARPDVVATGNVGCMMHLSEQFPIPIVHTIELLDWATGGPKPAKLAARRSSGLPAARGALFSPTNTTHDVERGPPS